MAAGSSIMALRCQLARRRRAPTARPADGPGCRGAPATERQVLAEAHVTRASDGAGLRERPGLLAHVALAVLQPRTDLGERGRHPQRAADAGERPVPADNVADPVPAPEPEQVALSNENFAWLSALKRPVALATNVPCLSGNLTKSPLPLGVPFAVSRCVDPESPIAPVNIALPPAPLGVPNNLTLPPLAPAATAPETTASRLAITTRTADSPSVRFRPRVATAA